MTAPHSSRTGAGIQPLTIEEITSALSHLGGEADVAAIVDRLAALRGAVPPQYDNEHTYRSAIQELVDEYCPQSPRFEGIPRFVRLRRRRYRVVLADPSGIPASLLGWWVSQPEEHFWLEITDREDLGVNLRAAQTNEDGNEFWSYSLTRAVRPRDVVFHYHKDAQAIVALSRAAGAVWEEEIVWAAHGTSARDAGTVPHRRPGWCLGLEAYTPLAPTVTLEDLRSSEQSIRHVRAALKARFGDPLYFSFELSSNRALRPTQGYLTKLPSGVVQLLPPLRDASALLPRSEPSPPRQLPKTSTTIGGRHRRANEEALSSLRDPFAVEPALVERGLRGHAYVQNLLATILADRGLEPKSPNANDPNFDIAWSDNDKTFVGEIKSLTQRNEEKQLRLGLGQALRFRHVLSKRHNNVIAVLAVEREPSDKTWLELCTSLDVRLVWPGVLEKALA